LSDFVGFAWLDTDGKGHRQEIDIWLPRIKLAIEYDGEQHFYPVSFGSSSKEKTQSAFKRTKWLDKRKNRLIGEHKDEIPFFIRFSYKEKTSLDDVDYIIKRLKSVFGDQISKEIDNVSQGIQV
jgi:hypothetical protein